MKAKMTIRKQILLKAFERIIAKLEEDNLNTIEVNTDWYRIITADKWDDFSFQKDLAVTGSLKDDLEEVEKMVNHPDRICTYVDFDRVSSLLRAISQEVNPPN